MRKADLGEFDRLRTERFQELREMVERAGFLICDTNRVAYTSDDDSPGIDARVLVLLQDSGGEEESPTSATEPDDDDDDSGAANPGSNLDGEHGSPVLERLASAGSCRLRMILSALRLGDLTRLKSARFAAVLQDVFDRGYEVVALDGTILRPGAPSPGIDARVKLKRRFAPTPIAFVGAGTPAPAPVLNQVSDYELAVARLKVLTGVPWLDRRAAPSWPSQFLQFATNSVSLDDSQRQLLSLFAEKFVTGVHDIQQPLSLMRDSQDRGRLAALVDAFEFLNDAAGDEVPKVAAHMRNRLGLTSGVPSTEVVPLPEVQHDRATESRAAAASGNDSLNVRDLGALKGIFD